MIPWRGTGNAVIVLDRSALSLRYFMIGQELRNIRGDLAIPALPKRDSTLRHTEDVSQLCLCQLAFTAPGFDVMASHLELPGHDFGYVLKNQSDRVYRTTVVLCVPYLTIRAVANAIAFTDLALIVHFNPCGFHRTVHKVTSFQMSLSGLLTGGNRLSNSARSSSSGKPAIGFGFSVSRRSAILSRTSRAQLMLRL